MSTPGVALSLPAVSASYFFTPNLRPPLYWEKPPGKALGDETPQGREGQEHGDTRPESRKLVDSQPTAAVGCLQPHLPSSRYHLR